MLLWDVDGTLISNARSDPSLYRLAVGAVLPQLSPIPEVVSHGRTDTEVLRLMVRQAGLDADCETEVCVRCLQELNLLTAERVADLRLARTVLPGISEFLEQAARVGYRHGLLTGNSRKRAEIKLSTFGLWKYFDTSLSAFGDESESRIEVARLAVMRVRSHAAHPERLSVSSIGDTPKDVEAALACRIPVIGVATGIYAADTLRESGATLVISSFAEEGAVALGWLRSCLATQGA